MEHREKRKEEDMEIANLKNSMLEPGGYGDNWYEEFNARTRKTNKEMTNLNGNFYKTYLQHIVCQRLRQAQKIIV